MVEGRVSSDGREAVIPVDLFGEDGRSRRIEALVDTGFTDRLTLPPEVAWQLDLPLVGSSPVMLADGSVTELRIFRAAILWHGRRRTIRAYEAQGDPLVGMALLRGGRLTVDTVPGGVVRVEKLT